MKRLLNHTPAVPINDFYQHPLQTSPAIYVDETRQKPGASAEGRSILWMLGLNLEGTCLYQAGEQQLLIKAGEFAITRPRVDIHWRVPEARETTARGKGSVKVVPEKKSCGWRALYAIFEPRSHWFPWLNYEDTIPGLIVLPLRDEKLYAQILEDFRAALRIYRKAGAHRDDWALLKLEEILLRLFMHHEKQHSSVDPRVQLAVEFIRQHYARPMTLRDIGQASHLSVSQLSLLFSTQIGVAPIQFLESVRLSRALEMLRFSSDSISEIAAATGFRDPEYFARRLRIHLGETPREYRRKAQAEG